MDGKADERDERAVNAVSGKASRQSHGAAGFQGNYWSAENEASPQPCLDSSSRTTELLLRREYRTLHQQKMEEEYKFKSAQSK